jgi:hypothetical protein
MPVTRLLQIIAGVCGVIALTFGLGTSTHADLITIHLLFGLLVSFALLVQAILAASTSGLRRLGIISMVYATSRADLWRPAANDLGWELALVGRGGASVGGRRGDHAGRNHCCALHRPPEERSGRDRCHR